MNSKKNLKTNFVYLYSKICFWNLFLNSIFKTILLYIHIHI